MTRKWFHIRYGWKRCAYSMNRQRTHTDDSGMILLLKEELDSEHLSQSSISILPRLSLLLFYFFNNQQKPLPRHISSRLQSKAICLIPNFLIALVVVSQGYTSDFHTPAHKCCDVTFISYLCDSFFWNVPKWMDFVNIHIFFYDH